MRARCSRGTRWPPRSRAATISAMRFPVLPVTEDAALAGVAAARRVGGAKAPDVMIAGVALEHGLRVLTADADFARLIGHAADVLRAS